MLRILELRELIVGLLADQGIRVRGDLREQC